MGLSERSPVTRQVLGNSDVAVPWLDRAHLAALKMPYLLKSCSSGLRSLHFRSCLDGDSCRFPSRLQQAPGAGLSSAPVLQWGPQKHLPTATRLLPLVSTAHTPDNSFMGFVSEELNKTERQFIKSNKVSSMAVVYGKEASIWKVGVPGSTPAGRSTRRQSRGVAAASGSYPQRLRHSSRCLCREASLSPS